MLCGSAACMLLASTLGSTLLAYPMRSHARGARAGKQQAAPLPAAPADAAAAAAFERVTEAASALMDSGELDVYSLERCGAKPVTSQPAL